MCKLRRCSLRSMIERAPWFRGKGGWPGSSLLWTNKAHPTPRPGPARPFLDLSTAMGGADKMSWTLQNIFNWNLLLDVGFGYDSKDFISWWVHLVVPSDSSSHVAMGVMVCHMGVHHEPHMHTTCVMTHVAPTIPHPHHLAYPTLMNIS